MADHQYPPSQHQSHHHPQQYQPPSPASSTDSRSNSSNDRNQFPRNSSSPVKPTIPPSHSNPQNSNLDRPTASTAGNTQGFNAGAVYPPPYNPNSSSSHYPRPSPPPEHQVAYPTAPPGQNPSWGEQHDYHPSYHLQQRHISPVHHPNTPSWNPHKPSPPVQPPSATQTEDPNAQVDQLDDDLTAVPQSAPGLPPVISPPESPPQGSITLTAPNLPYHPRIHYPISSPGSDQPSSRQYSFVSLPGNAMRKRPRRKFDEIERLYACSFPGCTKAYGTLNHLNAHVSMQRHGPKRTPGEFKDMRRARKQAQREQARAAAARDHQEEADGEDNGSPVAGPSTSPASSSRPTKRKIRRATEPALQVPRIPSLDDAGPNMPEEFGRLAQASRQQQQLEMSRRVSMDDYALQQAAGMMDRRGSGGSDEDTQGDDLADQPGPSSTQRILGAMPSGPMGSTEQPLGLHGAHTTSPPALVSSGGQLPPMSMESQGQSMQFWQQHQHQQPSSVAAQHQAPISPTTVVAPHVSHLPGPGPAVPPGMPLHTSSSAHHPRQPSWPPSSAYGGGSSSQQQVAQQQSGGGPPPLVPATSYSSHHSNPLPFPLQPSVQPSQQTQSPPSHMQPQQQTHNIQHSIGVPTPSPPRSAPQTQTQHFQAHSQQQYSASPPPAAVHRLHQGSMLLTPLNVGGSHRQSYAQEPSGTQSNQPSAYGQTTIGGASASSSAQGLPSVFELENLSRDPAQEQRGSIQQQQHAQQSAPIVQQPQTTSWESYQQSSTYSAAGPSHRAPDSYAAPPSLGRSVAYDPSREYYPPTSRPDMYGGQRNVVYSAAVPQSRPEAHPAAYGHPQRSVSYSAPASSDPYMVPGPSQSQRTDAQPPSSYIPARSESYSAGVSSRGDPGAAYASAPGGGRSDPYGSAQQQQQRQAPEQQQYQTIPPPQSHIPHHPGLHPQHLPSSDPAHPDPRHDPYGRGHPGPSEGPY